MDVTNNTALARYFTGRVEAAQKALTGLRLTKYADEVTVMLPTSAGDFERFVYWSEAMFACLHRWCALAEVRQQYPAKALVEAQRAVSLLARDARDLLTIYQARAARMGA